MTFRGLASAIAKFEGKKTQVKIGDIREILSIIVKMQSLAEDNQLSPLMCLAIQAKKLEPKSKAKKLKSKAK